MPGFRLLAMLAVSVCAWTNAFALTYWARDDMLIVYGDVVSDDFHKLPEALKPHIKYLVLFGPKGSDAELVQSLARVIESSGVTTVAHGNCHYGCTRMFLAGKQRMFSGGARLETTFLGLGGRFYTTGVPVIEDYAYVRSQTDIPGSYLRQYIQTQKSAMLIFHPHAKISRGASVYGCEDGALTVEKCSPLPELSALAMRVLTTNELYQSPNLVEAPDMKAPPPTNFAKLSDPVAIPTLSDKCRDIYARFQATEKPRAFVVSKRNGCWARAAHYMRPLKEAMDACMKTSVSSECRAYAVDDDVVFVPFAKPAVASPNATK